MLRDIIVRLPKIPKIKYRKCKRCVNKKKLPKLRLPNLKKNQSLAMHGISAGIITEVKNRNSLKQYKTKRDKEPIIGAGRGGKHYSKTSAMGRMAETAVKTIRQKR